MMSEASGEDHDWHIDCSDDERYEGKLEDDHHWAPEPSEIQRLFETLDNSRVLDISWQCPGRKHPASDESTKLQDNEEEEEEKSPECTDFDFADEVATPKLQRRSEAELRGSARKKTTSFDSVLSNMQRHRQLERNESKKTND